MIAVAEALELVTTNKRSFGIEEVPLLQSVNRVLAMTVFADRDLPPYHRVTMDGIAISSKVFEEGKRAFFIEKMQAAGQPVQQLNNVNNCIEVMTGAVLPLDTDAVIPYEDCELANGMVTIKTNTVRQYQHIHFRATDSKAGAVLIKEFTIVAPAHVGVMATAGISKVSVFQLPAVAICSTGDELVDIDQVPLPHQVRKSNVYMLAAALQKENITPAIYHLPDDKNAMQEELAAIVQSYNVILLSGAVSKGKFDFLPEVLHSLGMLTVFHRVAQKPGKPFLFGRFNNGTTVFGFPGNPVSTFVCYHIYFRKWLYTSLHMAANKVLAKLFAPVDLHSKLTNHLLATLQNKGGNMYVKPFFFSTSGDINSLLDAEAIVTLPAEQSGWKEEDVVEIIVC